MRIIEHSFDWVRIAVTDEGHIRIRFSGPRAVELYDGEASLFMQPIVLSEVDLRTFVPERVPDDTAARMLAAFREQKEKQKAGSMIETGSVIGLDGQPIYWHIPSARTSGSLPDSATLWKQLWDNRENISGFAHSHPGSGIPGPSYVDLTTFSAIELGLAKRLSWWITSADCVVILHWEGPGKYDYKLTRLDAEPSWATELRRLSKF